MFIRFLHGLQSVLNKVFQQWTKKDLPSDVRTRHDFNDDNGPVPAIPMDEGNINDTTTSMQQNNVGRDSGNINDSIKSMQQNNMGRDSGNLSDSITIMQQNNQGRDSGNLNDSITILNQNNTGRDSGNICDTVVSMIESGGPIIFSTINIGGKYHRVVEMPDGNLWLGENLDYAYSGLPVGGTYGTGLPGAWYYDNDGSTYGQSGKKYGLLYNWYAVNELNTTSGLLPEGWEVASDSDWNNLVNSDNNLGENIKSTKGWPDNGNGNDLYGFSLLPAGYQNGSGFNNGGAETNVWTSTESDATKAYYKNMSGINNVINTHSFDKEIAQSVRLINRNSAIIGDKIYKTVVMPDGKTWMAENLDYKFSGIKYLNSGHTYAEPGICGYRDFDEATYGWNGSRHGLWYNWEAAHYLNAYRSTLCPGWHVPTRTEWLELANALDSELTFGRKARSTTGWDDNGTNDYGFNVINTAYSTDDFDIYDGNATAFWTATINTDVNSYCVKFSGIGQDADKMIVESILKDRPFCIRLVKDT